jgi:hypothetical protein
MIGEAERYPLSRRVAAELWRGGVNVELFENEFHFEDNGFSRAVYENIMDFHLGKGPDPDFAPHVRPVYLRYVPPVRALAELAPVGRPSVDQALKFMRKIMRERIEKGWQEVDFIKALRALEAEIEPDSAPIKITSSDPVDELEDAKIIRKRLPPIYHVLVAGEWREAKTKQQAERLKTDAAAKAKLAPVEDPKSHCDHCKQPLGELVLVMRKDGKQACVHQSCYWMHLIEPVRIPLGMRMLCAADGAFYAWKGMPVKKGDAMIGGWVKEEPRGLEHSVTHEKNSQPDVSQGIPAPSGKESEPSKVVATKKTKRKSVSRVRRSKGKR